MNIHLAEAVAAAHFVVPDFKDIALLAVILQKNPVGGLLLVLMLSLCVVGLWMICALRQRVEPSREEMPRRKRKY